MPVGATFLISTSMSHTLSEESQRTLHALRNRLDKAERALDKFRSPASSPGNTIILFNENHHPGVSVEQLTAMLDEQELAWKLVRIAETEGVAAAMLYRLQHDKP